MLQSPRLTSDSDKDNVLHTYSDKDVADANQNGVGLWKIDRAGDFGWGIFALKDYQPHDFIFRGKSIKFQPRDSHTI